MRWTAEQYEEYKARRESFYPQPEQVVFHGSLAEEKRKGKDTARHVVRICSFRHRLLDPDNLTGGVKYFVDALRYAGLIPGDNPEQIVLEVSQVKIPEAEPERTEIEIVVP